MAAVSIPEKTAKLNTIKKILTYLPKGNYNLLAHLCLLLKEVSSLSDENKMTAENIGVIFAPNLLRHPNPNQLDIQSLMMEGRNSATLMTLLVWDAQYFFKEEPMEEKEQVKVQPIKLKPRDYDEKTLINQVTIKWDYFSKMIHENEDSDLTDEEDINNNDDTFVSIEYKKNDQIYYKIIEPG